MKSLPDAHVCDTFAVRNYHFYQRAPLPYAKTVQPCDDVTVRALFKGYSCLVCFDFPIRT